MWKYIPELAPSRVKKNLTRWWRINVNPPKESKIFVKPEEVKEVGVLLDSIKTKEQPKQVLYDHHSKMAYVSCMKGKSVQVFSVKDGNLELSTEKDFADQCVELAMDTDYLYVTTTNFVKSPLETKNKFYILSKDNLEVVSSVDTGGNWSKVMALNPDGTEVLISNWQTQNISVMDISDPKHPKLKQLLTWGKAPRGIEFTDDGKTAIVTGYYSGNLGVLEKDNEGVWNETFTSEPFDYPNYHGNMRHVLIDGDMAIVSNMGRSMVHFWSIGERKFVDSVSVGKYPNTICFLSKNIIAISCRESRSVYLLDRVSHKILGRSVLTSEEPTGLSRVDNNRLLVTGFKKGVLELHSFESAKIGR
ncbi:MAG TPA: hypothetical protein VLE44_03295 [Candidatus Saccharimonadales bacterium]|nr:hypothetical protein [Candidatus Saccharimonadales bacterium]